MNRAAGLRPRARRAGFTLIEVLLTSVLAATLLAAVWALLGMYFKMFDTGQTRTEQSQLARTLLEQISTDLHSITQAPPPFTPLALPLPAAPSGSKGGSSSARRGGGARSSSSQSGNAQSGNASPAASGATLVQPQQPLSAPNVQPLQPLTPAGQQAATSGDATSADLDTGFSPPGRAGAVTVSSSLRPAGLVGTDTFLQLDVLQETVVTQDGEWDEASASAPGTPAPTRAPQLRSVIYTFEERRDPGRPLEHPVMVLRRRELDWEQAHPASRDSTVARRVRASGAGASSLSSAGEAEASPEIPASTDSAMPLGPDPMLDELMIGTVTDVPEVVQFSLRYFDGSAWFNEWDSHARGRLPVAVEVAMRLRSYDEPAPPPLEPLGEMPPEEAKKQYGRYPLYRLLIHMPLGRPSPAPTNTPGSGSSFGGLRSLSGSR